MGLLSFLGTRKSFDRPTTSKPGLKGQPYDATTASLPPVQGTYPMAGNGPTNTLQTLQRSLHRRSTSDLTIEAASDNSAPAPYVPLFRDEPQTDRPRTAPNGVAVGGGGGGGGDQPRARLTRKNSSKGANGAHLPQPPALPSSRLRFDSMSSVTQSTKADSSRQPTQHHYTHSHNTQTHSQHHQQHQHQHQHHPNTSITFPRGDSMQSETSIKGFVDILDAQSELKPLNFQSRLRAAGARDYGEDVADRNIGENGVDLMSPQAQAFYALSGRTSASGWLDDGPDVGAPAPPVQRKAAAAASGSVYGEPFRPPTRTDSLDIVVTRGRQPPVSLLNPLAPLAQAHNSIPRSSPAPGHLEKYHDDRGRMGRHATSQPARARRRQSLSSYVPAPTHQNSSTAALAPRPKSMHKSTRSTSHMSSVESPSRPRSGSFPAPLTGFMAKYATTTTTTAAATNTTPHYNNSNNSKKLQSESSSSMSSFARDSVLLAKTNYSLPLSMRAPEKLRRERGGTSKSFSGEERREHQHSQREQHPILSGVPVPGSPRPFIFTDEEIAVSQGRQLLRRKTRPRSLRLVSGAAGVAAGAAGAGESLSMRDGSDGSDGLDVAPPASAPFVRRLGFLPADPWEVPYQRTKSLGSSSLGRSRLDEIYENIPIRTSSLNQWSASSATPTISSVSSARPHSRHTPNTSIDLATVSSRKKEDCCSCRSQGSGGAGDDVSSYGNSGSGGTAAALDQMYGSLSKVVHDRHSAFNIDDYLSSDDDIDADSISGPARSRGQGEGDLLFRDNGYGDGGLQLPGLFDSFPTTNKSEGGEEDVDVVEPEGVQPLSQSSHGSATLRRARSDSIPERSYQGTFLAPAPPPRNQLGTSMAMPMKKSNADLDDDNNDHNDDYVDGIASDTDTNTNTNTQNTYATPPVIPGSRTDLAPGRKGMRRISALGTVHQTTTTTRSSSSGAESGAEEKLDVRRAVRLRKEAKARQRLGVSRGERRGRGGGMGC